MLRLVGIICFAFCALGLYAVTQTFYIPTAPAPIALPIGEQNKTEEVRLQSQSYLVVKNLTLKDIPKTAYCNQENFLESTFSLRCVWATPGEPFPYATASVEAIPEIRGVAHWRFDREHLTAVPVRQEWLFANFVSLLGTIVMGVFTLVLGFVLLLTMWPKRKQQTT